MALPLWKSLLQTTKKMILQQRRLSLYNSAHGYEEELIKKKLQQFSGGSINLSKEDDGIGILTLNHPKLMNAFTGTMMVELQERVTELENWKDGKGLIIHGAGNTFCSGSDLNAVKEISNSQPGSQSENFVLEWDLKSWLAEKQEWLLKQQLRGGSTKENFAFLGPCLEALGQRFPHINCEGRTLEQLEMIRKYCSICSENGFEALIAAIRSSATVFYFMKDGMNMCMFMQNTLTRLMRLPLISVALVQGKAFGGGAELTTACDFRLMTPGSEIRFVHKHMGLVPGWGGAARLVRIVGSGAALQLLAGAARVDPERALRLGLSEGTLLASDETGALGEARAWLSQYTEGPTSVIRAVKKVVTAGRELPLEAALRTEKDIFGTVWGGPANLQALVRRPKHK